jgi:hypothetical protein
MIVTGKVEELSDAFPELRSPTRRHCLTGLTESCGVTLVTARLAASIRRVDRQELVPQPV